MKIITRRKFYFFICLCFFVGAALIVFHLITNKSSPQEATYFLSIEELRGSIKDFNKISITEKNERATNARLKKISYLLSLTDEEFNSDHALDIEMQNFLKDEKISRHEKIAAIWNLLKSFMEPNYNKIKIEYLIDSLAVLQPIEITDEIINAIKDRSYTDAATPKLIGLLSESFGMYARLDLNTFDNKSFDLITKNGEKIIDFLRQSITSETNDETFKAAIIAYSKMATSDDISMIQNELMRHKNILQAKDVASISIELIMMSPNVIETNIAPLLNGMGAYSREENKEFTKNLLNRLTNSEIKDNLSITSKLSILAYLEKNKPEISKEIFERNPLESTYDFGEWLDIYTELKSNSKEEYVSNIAELMNHASSYEMLGITRSLSTPNANKSDIINSLKSNRNLKDSLTYKLSDQSISESEREAIIEVMEFLK